MRLVNQQRTRLKPRQARRADGSLVEIHVVRVSGDDPTHTGTIYRSGKRSTSSRFLLGRPSR